MNGEIDLANNNSNIKPDITVVAYVDRNDNSKNALLHAGFVRKRGAKIVYDWSRRKNLDDVYTLDWNKHRRIIQEKADHELKLLVQEQDAQKNVLEVLEQLPAQLVYHAIPHTMEHVYPDAMRLAIAEGVIDPEERLVVAVTSLFHDTGFVKKYVANEHFGADYAYDYCINSGCKPLIVAAQRIYNAILNTNMVNPPSNKLEAILRDADLAILGKPEFLAWNERLRLEISHHPESLLYETALNEAEWEQSQLKFLESHKWFTQSAINLFQKQKEANIVLLRKNYARVL